MAPSLSRYAYMARGRVGIHSVVGCSVAPAMRTSWASLMRRPTPTKRKPPTAR